MRTSCEKASRSPALARSTCSGSSRGVAARRGGAGRADMSIQPSSGVPSRASENQGQADVDEVDRLPILPDRARGGIGRVVPAVGARGSTPAPRSASRRRSGRCRRRCPICCLGMVKVANGSDSVMVVSSRDTPGAARDLGLPEGERGHARRSRGSGAGSPARRRRAGCSPWGRRGPAPGPGNRPRPALNGPSVSRPPKATPEASVFSRGSALLPIRCQRPSTNRLRTAAAR